MKGDRVKDAQYLLKGANRFEKLATYKDGKIDGDYGILTAQATKRAKFWLGYPSNSLDGMFGQQLFEYLRPKNWRPLPKAFQERREHRLEVVAKDETLCLRAFREAEKHIGYREEPRHGINDNKFGREYGWNYVPWCAIFESICFKHSGWPNYRFASVERIHWAAMANIFKLFIVHSPKKGDIIGYQLHGDRYAHTAFFDSWVNSTTLLDLGGNTGPTDISNGGMVMKQQRPKTMVSFFARVIAA
jgi:hypothetical protein